MDRHAVALARLVQDATGARLADASIDTLLASWNRTRVVDLPRAVNVRLVYQLAEVRNDSLLLHPDIYSLRIGSSQAEALRVLASRSLDTTLVDRAGLRVLIRRARTQHAGNAISALFPGILQKAGSRVTGRAPLVGSGNEVGQKSRSLAPGTANCGR